MFSAYIKLRETNLEIAKDSDEAGHLFCNGQSETQGQANKAWVRLGRIQNRKECCKEQDHRAQQSQLNLDPAFGGHISQKAVGHGIGPFHIFVNEAILRLHSSDGRNSVQGLAEVLVDWGFRYGVNTNHGARDAHEADLNDTDSGHQKWNHDNERRSVVKDQHQGACDREGEI